MFFFFNDTATTEIYTLSLHDALPISAWVFGGVRLISSARIRLAKIGPLRNSNRRRPVFGSSCSTSVPVMSDRKSTRLNSSHANISYAVFCLKKKKNKHINSLIAQADY